ncbi:MAG: ATPase [Alphaproteobacteria bacterium]|nr:ATPase [Alphaproteobacteria bacterium]
MIIVFGNTKGGTGKSTLAVHITVDLLYREKRVICMDCDCDQGTLSRYWENRMEFQKRNERTIPMPLHTKRFSPRHDTPEAMTEHLRLLKDQRDTWDVLIIDTAGYDSVLSRYAHSLADILITPMNDSAIDLDLLVNVKETAKPGQLPLSHYAHLVWEQRMRKVVEESGTLEWIIVRNRMHSLSSRNQVQLDKILNALSQRIGFQMAHSVGERVIFRELFAYGLTVMDQRNNQGKSNPGYQEISKITDQILSFQDKIYANQQRSSRHNQTTSASIP